MRKRTRWALLSAFATLGILLVTTENWLLAALVGIGIGTMIFIFTHAYPHDIAPPADRRHENTQRRRGARV